MRVVSDPHDHGIQKMEKEIVGGLAVAVRVGVEVVGQPVAVRVGRALLGVGDAVAVRVGGALDGVGDAVAIAVEGSADTDSDCLLYTSPSPRD